MNHLKKLLILIIFLCIVPVAESLEYNKYSEPTFSIDNKTLIKSVDFCFEYNNETLCRKAETFRDDNFGIICGYAPLIIRQKDVVHYHFRCELNNSNKICPLVLNLDRWPQKIITDDFEQRLDQDSIIVEKFPFVLSGHNRSLYFPRNEEYEYNLSKSGLDYVLRICSKVSKNIHESSIEMVAISSELNKTNFHFHSSVSLYENPPTLAFGSERTVGKITITEFFTGRIFDWHPELPYANLAIELYPINESYDKNETLLMEFNSISGIDIEQLPYDVENKKWLFPKSGTRQIAFDYNSWLFPFSTYTTKIIIVENNISLTGNQTLKIPNSEFLDGSVSFDKNEIKIEIFYNWSGYLLLGIILCIFCGILFYSFRKIKSNKKIPSFAYFVQLIPFLSLIGGVIGGIIRLQSILFFVLLSSYACFLIYYIYKRHKKV